MANVDGLTGRCLTMELHGKAVNFSAREILHKLIRFFLSRRNRRVHGLIFSSTGSVKLKASLRRSSYPADIFNPNRTGPGSKHVQPCMCMSAIVFKNFKLFNKMFI